jgi:hypothetical protein
MPLSVIFAVDSGTAVGFPDCFCFPLSVRFHQISILIFTYNLLLPEKQTAEAYRPSKKQSRTLHNKLLSLIQRVASLEQGKLSFILKVFCHKLQWIIDSMSVPLLFSSFHVSREQIPSLKVRHTLCLYYIYIYIYIYICNNKDTICQHTNLYYSKCRTAVHNSRHQAACFILVKIKLYSCSRTPQKYKPMADISPLPEVLLNVTYGKNFDNRMGKLL